MIRCAVVERVSTFQKTDDGLGVNGATKHTEWTNIIPTLGRQSWNKL